MKDERDRRVDRRDDDSEDDERRRARQRRHRRDEEYEERSQRRDDSDFDDDEYEYEGASAIPVLLRVAGVIWIITGLVILVNAIALMAVAGQAEQNGVSGAAIAVLVIGFFGGVFIHVGLQSFNGTAKDALGNGIGSIVIGLLHAGSGALCLNVNEVFFATISFAGCASLIIAGIMALWAREDYMAWRAHNQGGESRRGGDRGRYSNSSRRNRRDYDDDRRDDDRDRRR